MKLFFLAMLFTALFLSGCRKTNSSPSILIDVEGNHYRTIMIGAQVWTIDNLRTKRTPDGNPVVSHIPNEDSSAVKEYGLLYDWQTAKRSIPNGWHLPSDEEWSILERNLDGVVVKDSNCWSTLAAQHVQGFCVRPAGYWNDGGFNNRFGNIAVFWTSTVRDSHFVWSRVISESSDSLRKAAQHPQYGFSVRCIKDN